MNLTFPKNQSHILLLTPILQFSFFDLPLSSISSINFAMHDEGVEYLRVLGQEKGENTIHGKVCGRVRVEMYLHTHRRGSIALLPFPPRRGNVTIYNMDEGDAETSLPSFLPAHVSCLVIGFVWKLFKFDQRMRLTRDVPMRACVCRTIFERCREMFPPPAWRQRLLRSVFCCCCSIKIEEDWIVIGEGGGYSLGNFEWKRFL